jgi:hypothetical protein
MLLSVVIQIKSLDMLVIGMTLFKGHPVYNLLQPTETDDIATCALFGFSLHPCFYSLALMHNITVSLSIAAAAVRYL